MTVKRDAYKLNELGFVGRGRSRHRPRNDPKLYGGEHPFFQTGDVKAAEMYLHRYSATYNEIGLSQSKIWAPGTLCITIAANIADSAILSIPGCFPDSVVAFVADPQKADTAFIKYYLDTLKQLMQSASRGTTQDNLSLDKLLTFDFIVPEVSEQRRIASILSAYDDLIENNTRRIEILEEMARRLYEEWFIHFRFPGHENVSFKESELGRIPEGWGALRLEEVATVNPDKVDPKSAPESIRYIDIASVSPGRVDHMQEMAFSKAPGRARRKVQSGDIIWACVRPNRRSHALILSPQENTIASTGFAVLRAKDVPSSYLYQTVKTHTFADYLVNHATGAAYPAVNQSVFEAAKVIRPPDELLEVFDATVKPMLLQTDALDRQNANLRAQRDLLLPKLISGKISVESSETIHSKAAA